MTFGWGCHSLMDTSPRRQDLLGSFSSDTGVLSPLLVRPSLSLGCAVLLWFRRSLPLLVRPPRHLVLASRCWSLDHALRFDFLFGTAGLHDVVVSGDSELRLRPVCVAHFWRHFWVPFCCEKWLNFWVPFCCESTCGSHCVSLWVSVLYQCLWVTLTNTKPNSS